MPLCRCNLTTDFHATTAVVVDVVIITGDSNGQMLPFNFLTCFPLMFTLSTQSLPHQQLRRESQELFVWLGGGEVCSGIRSLVVYV